MQTILSILVLSTALATPALAQDHSAHAGHGAPATSTAAADTAMTVGEITRVDTRTGKLTIRHEEIKNIGMPGMTMVCGLQDAGQATAFKAGDKVRFHVEDKGGALTITRIEAIK